MATTIIELIVWSGMRYMTGQTRVRLWQGFDNFLVHHVNTGFET